MWDDKFKGRTDPEIESAREVLNKSLDEKKQYDEVYQNSILLDTLIEQYIEAGY